VKGVQGSDLPHQRGEQGREKRRGFSPNTKKNPGEVKIRYGQAAIVVIGLAFGRKDSNYLDSWGVYDSGEKGPTKMQEPSKKEGVRHSSGGKRGKQRRGCRKAR